MSLHDTYARLTPFELAFRNRERAEVLADAVNEEAAARLADPEDPQLFITMGSVGEFLEELRGPDSPPGAVHRYGALAFHGVHFTTAGCPVYLMSTHVARYLVEGAPSGAPKLPTRAGYLQLPQHLFWTDSRGAEQPESVDGVFWTSTGGGALHTLLATGVRPDGTGIGVIPLPEAPISDVDGWIEAQVREEGDDFSSGLPGSDLDHLYAFQTAGEVLKLLARFFAYVHSAPNGLEPPRISETPQTGPVPSELSFTRVNLDG
jgi:hypothetical protein